MWNRPVLVAGLMSILQNLQPKKLYVASDGPLRDDNLNRQKVQHCRELIEESISWPVQLRTRYCDSNNGCRAGVASAISWFFEHETEGIILEDDVHPIPSFFPFMEELLEKYRDDQRIGSISSHNFHRLPVSSNSSSYSFSIYNHCWGWGSWRRAWNQYDYSLSTWPSFRDQGFLVGLGDVRFQRYWTRILNATHQGKIDTWDFAWTYSHWHAGMLACTPDRCLVRNTGFGPDAIHTIDEVYPLPAPIAINEPLRHPSVVRARVELDKLTQYYQFRDPSLITRLGRLFRRWLRKISWLN